MPLYGMFQPVHLTATSMDPLQRAHSQLAFSVGGSQKQKFRAKQCRQRERGEPSVFAIKEEPSKAGQA